MNYKLPNFESLSKEQREMILVHLHRVMELNKTMNLTRIDTEKEGMLLHVEDSLTALPEMNMAPKGLYGDLGSGAGYPGIPLSIATGRNTILIDARMKKMNAIKSVVEEIGLDNQIEAFAGRVELLSRKKRGEFCVLTARALSKLSVLLELASPLLVKGGCLICFKSHVEQDEFEHALKVQNQVGMNLVSDRSFIIGEDYYRRLLVFERLGDCRVKLPRQEGMAQKQPL